MRNDTGKNYGNMHFTDDERKALIKNRIAITDWIHREIIPRMPHDSKISIGFGGTHYSGYSECPMYTLVVHSEPHRYYGISGCTWEDEDIQIGIANMFGRADNFESGYKSKSPYSILPVVDNWSRIKSELKYEADKLRRQNKQIFEFEV